MRILIRHEALNGSIDDRIRSIVPDAMIDHLKPEDAGFDEAWRSCEVFLGGPLLERAGEAVKLRWVQVPWSGIARVGEAAPGHWLITRGAGMFGPGIAEHVFAMLLHFRRNLHLCVEAQREKRWGVGKPALVELSGQTMLILGLGDIGKAVAVRAAAFGMRVVGVKRNLDGPLPQGVERIITMDQLDAALPEADVIVGCLPGTKHTRGLIGRDRLALMKPTAGLINIGRGSLIDQAALVDALQQGQLAWAALDVFDPEPLPADHPLWTLPNVLITPHISGGTDRATQRLAELFLTNLRHYAAGKVDAMINVFSREWQY